MLMTTLPVRAAAKRATNWRAQQAQGSDKRHDTPSWTHQRHSATGAGGPPATHVLYVVGHPQGDCGASLVAKLNHATGEGVHMGLQATCKNESTLRPQCWAKLLLTAGAPMSTMFTTELRSESGQRQQSGGRWNTERRARHQNGWQGKKKHPRKAHSAAHTTCSKRTQP